MCGPVAERSGIGWTDDTRNWMRGCSKTSDACLNCYITRTVPFRVNHLTWSGDGGIGSRIPLQFFPEQMRKPLTQARPRRIFINSLGDTFHEDVPLGVLADAFAYMALSPRHTYQVLTKRDRRMRIVLNDPRFWDLVGAAARRIAGEMRDLTRAPVAYSETLHDGSSVWDDTLWQQPRALGNVWLGVTAENRPLALRRLTALRRTPAAVRFASLEPMREALDISDHLRPLPLRGGGQDAEPGLDWVITGGETGARAVARGIHPSWVRSIRDQCRDAGVAHFFKQWGSWATSQHEDDPWAGRDPQAWVNQHDGAMVRGATAGGAAQPSGDGWAPLWYAGLSSKPAGNHLDGDQIEQHPRPRAVVAA